jgi:hypothetical protein
MENVCQEEKWAVYRCACSLGSSEHRDRGYDPHRQDRMAVANRDNGGVPRPHPTELSQALQVEQAQAERKALRPH